MSITVLNSAVNILLMISQPVKKNEHKPVFSVLIANVTYFALFGLNNTLLSVSLTCFFFCH